MSPHSWGLSVKILSHVLSRRLAPVESENARRRVQGKIDLMLAR